MLYEQRHSTLPTLIVTAVTVQERPLLNVSVTSFDIYVEKTDDLYTLHVCRRCYTFVQRIYVICQKATGGNHFLNILSTMFYSRTIKI